MGFFVKSKEDSVCPSCGSPLKQRDKRRRICRTAGGTKQWFIINRLQCTGKGCRKLHNELPDCLCPYKHYQSQLIEDVIDEAITEQDLACEDYPSEGTVKGWKIWMKRNRAHVDGQIKSMGDHLLDLGIELARTMDSLLEELKERIYNGWLRLVMRFLYNHGGGFLPSPT